MRGRDERRKTYTVMLLVRLGLRTLESPLRLTLNHVNKRRVEGREEEQVDGINEGRTETEEEQS